MNRRICRFLLINMLALFALTTCHNPWMDAVVGDLFHNNNDFGKGAGITTLNVYGGDLGDTLRNGLTEPGNYVINISTDAYLEQSITISGDITVSLRGNGKTIYCGDSYSSNYITVTDNAKLILRDVTLDTFTHRDNGRLLEINNNGILILEAGSAITSSNLIGSAVIVGDEGSFIMNGGIIFGVNSVDHSVVITGRNARFEKMRGGIIFGGDAPEGFRNASNDGYILYIIPLNSTDRYYRDTTINSNETVNVIMDSTGERVLRMSGNWEGDDPFADPDLSGDITIEPNTGVTTYMELTAVYDGDEDVSYQWRRGETVVGANSDKHTPTEAGSYTVTVSAAGYNSKTSDPVNVVNAELSGSITITPDTDVTTGMELTANYSGSEDVSYQWKRGETIVGANSNKYTPTEAGSYTVTVSAAGYNIKTSAAVAVTEVETETPDLPGDITITPAADVTTGMELTANYLGSENVSYQWKRGATDVGTNSDKYTPTEAGSYTVTVSAAGYNSKTSLAVTVTEAVIVTPDLSGDITISPVAGVTVGMELTANYSGSENVSYQWKRGATDVGTNSNKYTPDQTGSYTVTVSAAGYESKTSEAVTVTEAVTPDLSGDITINPTTNVTTHTELTAIYTGNENITLTYQWKRGVTDVGTNSDKYTPDQAGSYTVTVSAAGYNIKTSDPVNVVNSTLSGNITITTNTGFAVGEVLTAIYTGNENITLTYQWKRGATDVGTNSDKYTPTEAGSYSVTVSAGGYNSKTSVEVEVFANLSDHYNELDFGEGAVIIEVLTVDLSSEPDYTLNDVFYDISLLEPGNYVIDVSGDAELWEHPFFYLHNTDVTISLRGNGGAVLTTGGNYNFPPILLYSGNTLILRDITIKQDNSLTFNPIINVSGGTLIMEEGSVITAEVECRQGVIVNNGGSFIMNGGEIRGLETSSSTVTISGGGSSFEKTGGVIYGAASGINGNTPDTGYLVEVLEYDPVVGYLVDTLYYRNSSTDLTGTLSVTMNDDGTGVSDISSGWSQ